MKLLGSIHCMTESGPRRYKRDSCIDGIRITGKPSTFTGLYTDTQKHSRETFELFVKIIRTRLMEE